MRLQIATRHCEVPESVRRRAQGKVTRLVRYDSRLSSAELIFEEERHVRRVEGILTIHGGEPVVAGGEADDFGAAVDRLVDRLSRMLRRRRELARDHQAPPIKEAAVPGE